MLQLCGSILPNNLKKMFFLKAESRQKSHREHVLTLDLKQTSGQTAPSQRVVICVKLNIHI